MSSSTTSPLPFNNMVDRKKPTRRVSADDLTMVKAAAWAWYQHGSGSSDRPTREFVLERTEKVLKPSRYKMEAIKEIEHVSSHHQRSSSAIPGNTNNNYVSGLLDKYEIQRISLQLDRYIENSSHAAAAAYYSSDRRRVASLSSESGTTRERKSKKPLLLSSKRFWLRNNGTLLCRSSSTDVVETASSSPRWPPPEKHVFPAVKTVACGPRASCI